MLLRLVSRPAEVPAADERLALAALLVEAARADGDYAPEEKAQIGCILAARFGNPDDTKGGVRPGPTQCHDITVYPAIGRAGGACEGYGLLLDITDPVNPKRIGAVADSNFSY